ncbi:o-succinylbenzoate--CoA ligase [Lysinibacillus sp. BW-2-10]|uniref:o-succinylbenzoate--CoA ligase n=1 Tax=Lysinibacillus sp. BW-2-10 TaxID=2590030 RepID=UPI00117CB54D|nr:o-succinylbenzoate--CoA ligase [Lysinibacillus sp. BW-2-10]TSI03033.1 o-succinylbenzoate--CoA ligase [Lysinibacillus sp. BW-2-10]
MYPNWILRRAYLTPHRTGLTFENESWTFEQIKQISIKRTYQLAGLGINHRQRIAVLGPSKPSLIFIMYACMHLQCEMVMLNRKLSKSELQYQIEDSQVEMVLVEDEDAHLLPANTNHLLFSKILESAEEAVEISEEWPNNQTTTIMYTSGTTGFPKGVRQTVENHQSSAVSSVLNIGLSHDDVWLCAVPLFHISGFSILVRSLLYGNEVKLYQKFEQDEAVRDISEGSVTHMSVVAVILGRILQGLEEKQLKASPRFKVMLPGGGPVPVNYLERAHKLGLAVCQTYGMTETSSQTATLSNADALRKIGSVGKPLFFNQIKILDATSPRTEGEILIRGPHVTPGYIGRFAERSSTINGWLHTGDIGYFDEEGYLYVVDRRSDLIISGGENVYPAEVENVLMGHPAVREAGVCGIEHEVWGQVPVAFVVLKHDVTEEELIAFCKEKLAKYKIPKQFYVVQALPRNASNKLMRRKLKELMN